MIAQIDSKYSRYGLNKVIKRLVSYTLFEGRPHTTKGQWFNPVVFLLLRILNKIPCAQKLKQPIFITGLGRSGTTILGIMLSLHKDVGFLNEPKAIWRTIDSMHDINGDYIQNGGKFRLTKKDVTDDARKISSRIFSHYLSTVRAHRLVDKYPELIFRINYLLELFPDAKIIFISRNGADATHSINLWSKRLGVEVKGRIDDWWGRDDIKWHYLRDQIILKDPDYSSIKESSSLDLDHINRAALEWVITMREGLKQLKLYPDSVIHIQYEALTKNPDQELHKLMKKCNLATDEKVIKYAKEKLYTNTPKDNPKLLPAIEKLFNETMAELGYTKENQ
ncbi:hypothetical protein MNBD_GAMMA09-3263 [hydrothermal vent metagenome]|uniref:Sulfotransferase n=1 Tax=hydrothermal vent metagenome TaxID=652676 RepID=A0A3B0XNK4_9ZZZZ